MSVHNLRTERMQPGDVYVGRKTTDRRVLVEAEGRDGYFGNPFPVDGVGYSRQESIRRFTEVARARLMPGQYGDPEYRRRVGELHGKRLFCWCHPKPCHAEVLARLAAEVVAAEVLGDRNGPNDA
jgi:hypothetical protein